MSQLFEMLRGRIASHLARGKWMSACNFAFADCLKLPVIERIQRREDCIRVQATDTTGERRPAVCPA